MKVTGTSIEQLEGGKPRGKCRHWRLWLSTECGRKSRRFTGTWTQAQEALRAFKSEMEGLVPNSDTFGAYAASWLAYTSDTGRYSAGTMANRARDVKALTRVLGDARMDSVTPEDCKAALSNLKHGGSMSGLELSNTYMAGIHSTLKAVLQTAEDDGRIARNPMARVPCPKPDTAERDWLSPAEVADLLAKLDAQPVTQWTMALYLILYLGLRRGEAVALPDADVDVQPDGFGAHVGTCRVHQAFKEASHTVEEPKTPAGNRTLPMPAALCAKVVEWRHTRALMGFGDAAYLCCNARGQLMHAQNLARWWRLNRDGYGCPDIGLHQLRHSNLSMMARRMSPFDLKDWAGWSSIAPARIYVHRDIDSMRAAVNDVWGMLSAPDLHHPSEQASQSSG